MISGDFTTEKQEKSRIFYGIFGLFWNANIDEKALFFHVFHVVHTENWGCVQEIQNSPAGATAAFRNNSK